MSIKKILTGIWYRLNQNKIKYEEKKLCGRTLLTTLGTIRENPDQDDAWFFYLAQNREVIFDIGANVGYTGLLAMIQNPHREYIMVDPNPKALTMASGNLWLNNLGFKARFYSAFVSDKMNQMVKFYTIGAGAAGSMHADHAKSAAAVNAHTEVQTITLDYLFDYYKIVPNLVKIDVEGAEGLVMQGAKELAKSAKPDFFIEMHAVENISMEQNAQIMIDWCLENNYTPWYMSKEQKLTSAHMIQNRGKCHLLLIPQGKEYPKCIKGVKERAKLPENI